jgi:tRNA pseudouridine55 synthase
LDGVLVIDKPEGMSSTEVVEHVKKKLRVKKAGHAGTLDPFATGVLPICVGRGTKIAQFILDSDKEYEGDFELGVVTETFDLTGEIVERRPVPDLSLEEIQRVFDQYVGIIEQRPPAFSAAKFHGRPLYKYAREGLKVEKPPKKVEVLVFEALRYDPPLVHFRVYCSKGTYIRSLVHDVGQKLGCGAALVRLKRLRKGPFTLDQALSLNRFDEEVARGEIERHIIPVERALEFIPSLTIGPEVAKRIRQGRPLAISSLANLIRLQKVPQKPRVPWLRLITPDGSLVAVLEYPSDLHQPGNAKMIRVFPEG